MQWNLIRLRKEAGFTQQDMADKLGIHITSYFRKENGTQQFRADEMFLLRDLFKVPMEKIFLPTDCSDNAINVEKQ